MEFFSRTKRIGGSLMMTIPRSAAKELGLWENETIEVKITKHKKSFFGAFPWLSKYSEKDRLDVRP